MKKEFIDFVVGKKVFPAAAILPAGKLSVREALQVYKNAYLARLTSALGETYLTTWRLLGDKEFFRLAEKYIRKHDSKHYNLNRYGANFPEYVARLYGKKSIIYQMGAFERIIDSIFHLPEPDNAFALGEGIKATAKVSLADTATLFAGDYAVDELWINRNGRSFSGVKKQGQKQYLLIYKYNMLIHIKKIGHKQYLGLKSAQKPVSLNRFVDLLRERKYCVSESEYTELFKLLGIPGVAKLVLE